MKLNVTAVLSLSLLLVHIHFSLATKRIRIKDKIDLFKAKILDTKTKLKHPKQNNRGSHPQQAGYPAPGRYHQYPGYPAPGSPYAGAHGGYGGYPGGYINHNPSNKVLSPRYGGSFGYGGYGVGGGSPYAQSVQAMGAYPSDRSRGFGHSGVMAAAGGAMAGMALGYGLGRFPRPHFSFHSPQEEYYYNHYMYRKYGVRSTDSNDYSRDYKYAQPPMTYDSFMDSCVRRVDLLSGPTRTSNKAHVTVPLRNTTTTRAPETNADSNTTTTNSTAAGNTPTSAPSTLRSVNGSEASRIPPASQTLRDAATEDEDDDDTVSIMEIGYPALIRDVKVRRCVELYMAYSEKYLKRRTETPETGGAERPESAPGGLVAVAVGAAVTLLNSNLLILLH